MIVDGFSEQMDELAVVVSGQVKLWNSPDHKPDGPVSVCRIPGSGGFG